MTTAFLISASWVLGQDMPPLPDMPDGTPTTSTAPSGSAPALPPLPDNGNASVAPSSAAAPMPALPTTTDTSAQPPLPSGTSTSGTTAALPPLPDQGTAPVPPQTNTTASSSPALPPLPGSGSTTETTTPPETKALPAPSENVPPITTGPKTKHYPRVSWPVPPIQPNVIFGGWIHGKGSNPIARAAWASQEVMNALIFRGYKNHPDLETGNYPGQSGNQNQWRSMFFTAPKTKVTLQVYVKPEGNKVWMRVGPDEPPAGQKMAKVVQLKNEDWKALQIIRTHLKGRLAPHVVRADWTARFHRPQETADE